jgi:hypothetical protein
MVPGASKSVTYAIVATCPPRNGLAAFMGTSVCRTRDLEGLVTSG